MSRKLRSVIKWYLTRTGAQLTVRTKATIDSQGWYLNASVYPRVSHVSRS